MRAWGAGDRNAPKRSGSRGGKSAASGDDTSKLQLRARHSSPGADRGHRRAGHRQDGPRRSCSQRRDRGGNKARSCSQKRFRAGSKGRSCSQRRPRGSKGRSCSQRRGHGGSGAGRQRSRSRTWSPGGRRGSPRRGARPRRRGRSQASRRSRARRDNGDGRNRRRPKASKSEGGRESNHEDNQDSKPPNVASEAEGEAEADVQASPPPQLRAENEVHENSIGDGPAGSERKPPKGSRPKMRARPPPRDDVDAVPATMVPVENSLASAPASVAGEDAAAAAAAEEAEREKYRRGRPKTKPKRPEAVANEEAQRLQVEADRRGRPKTKPRRNLDAEAAVLPSLPVDDAKAISEPLPEVNYSQEEPEADFKVASDAEEAPKETRPDVDDSQEEMQASADAEAVIEEEKVSNHAMDLSGQCPVEDVAAPGVRRKKRRRSKAAEAGEQRRDRRRRHRRGNHSPKAQPGSVVDAAAKDDSEPHAPPVSESAAEAAGTDKEVAEAAAVARSEAEASDAEPDASASLSEAAEQKESAVGGGAADDAKLYLPLIRGVYERCNPAKLDSLDDLVNKYEGRLREVYESVCVKYGEEPEDPCAAAQQSEESAAEGDVRKAAADAAGRSSSATPNHGSAAVARQRQGSPREGNDCEKSGESIEQASASAPESSEDKEGATSIRKRHKKVAKGKHVAKKDRERKKKKDADEATNARKKVQKEGKGKRVAKKEKDKKKKKTAGRVESCSRSDSPSNRSSSSRSAEKRERKERRRMAKLAAQQAQVQRMQSQMMGALHPFPGLMQPLPGLPMPLNMMAGMPPGYLPAYHQEMQKKRLQDDQDPAESAPAKTHSVDELRALIKGVYERKNPAKLGELGVLFSKYAGSELDVYRHVCQKYGEAVQTPVQEPSADVAAVLDEAAVNATPAPAESREPLGMVNAERQNAGATEKREGGETVSKSADEEEEFTGGWPFRGEPFTDNEDSDGPVYPEWLVEAKRPRPAPPVAPRMRIPQAVLAADFDSDSNSSSSSSPAVAPGTLPQGLPGHVAAKVNKKEESSSDDGSSSEGPMKSTAALRAEASQGKPPAIAASLEAEKAAKLFPVGSAVLYWSDTHRQWTNAVVSRQNFDAKGALVNYDLDVKKGAQASRITLPSRPHPPPPSTASVPPQSEAKVVKTVDAPPVEVSAVEAAKADDPDLAEKPAAEVVNSCDPQPAEEQDTTVVKPCSPEPAEEQETKVVKPCSPDAAEEQDTKVVKPCSPEAAEEQDTKDVKQESSVPTEAPATEDLQQMYSQLFRPPQTAQEDKNSAEDTLLHDKFTELFNTTPRTEQRQTQAGALDGPDSPTGDQRALQVEVEMLEGEIDELFPGNDGGSTTEESSPNHK